MKFMVSARLKLPCMPWPCRNTVSATSTVQLIGSSHPVAKERKLTTIEGVGVTALPLRLSCDIGSVPEQRLDRAFRELLVLVRQVDQVRSAVGGNHQIGLCGILPEHAISGLGMSIFGNARVLVVRIEQRQVERFSKIDREKAHGEEILGRILITGFRRRTALAFL